MKKLIIGVLLIPIGIFIGYLIYFSIPPEHDYLKVSRNFHNIEMVKKFEGNGVLSPRDCLTCLKVLIKYSSESDSTFDGQMAFPAIELRIAKNQYKHQLHDYWTNMFMLVESYKLANHFSENELYSAYLQILNIDEMSNSLFQKSPESLSENEMFICYYKKLTGNANISARARYLTKKFGQLGYQNLLDRYGNL